MQEHYQLTRGHVFTGNQSLVMPAWVFPSTSFVCNCAVYKIHFFFFFLLSFIEVVLCLRKMKWAFTSKIIKILTIHYYKYHPLFCQMWIHSCDSEIPSHKQFLIQKQQTFCAFILPNPIQVCYPTTGGKYYSVWLQSDMTDLKSSRIRRWLLYWRRVRLCDQP